MLKQSNPYSRGLGFLAKAGKLEPTADRVILRAIHADDGSDLAIGTFRDAKKAVAFEIVAIGPSVNDEKIKIGRYCFHISAAHDAVDYDRDDSEFIAVRADHIVATWDHASAQAARDKVDAEAEFALVERANRLADIAGINKNANQNA